MDQFHWMVLIIAIVAVALASFFLGIDIAEGHAKKAKKELSDRLRWEQKNYNALSEYVRQNWPDVYAAYQKGHADGYQQGVLQSPELDE